MRQTGDLLAVFRATQGESPACAREPLQPIWRSSSSVSVDGKILLELLPTQESLCLLSSF